jgi:surface polysaccharide O-acyltransferase-like enzyme
MRHPTTGTIGEDREIWADRLRGVAVCLVVLLHSTWPFLERYPAVSGLDWQVANLVASVARICVPLFVMLSGYLLLHRDIADPLAFWRSRLPRLLGALILWFFVAAAFYDAENGIPFDPGAILGDLLTGHYAPYAVPLWYLYMMIGLTLAAPFLRAIVAAGPRFAWTFWILCALANPVFYAIERLHGTDFAPPFGVGFFAPYAFYFVAGHLVRRNRERLDALPPLRFIVMLAIGVAWSFGTAAALTLSAGTLYDRWYDFLSPNVAITTIAAFVLARRWRRPGWTGTLFAHLGRHSFGIYLSHMIFVSGTQGLLTMPVYLRTIAILPPFVAWCVAAADAATALLARVPVVRRFV